LTTSVQQEARSQIDSPAPWSELANSSDQKDVERTANIAIVHDYLTQRRGAERVVQALLSAFPDAPLYTTFHDKSSTFPEFNATSVHTAALNWLPLFRRHPKWAFPIIPTLVEHLELPKVDAVLCSSSGWSHGVKPSSQIPKIVYCYNPPRWLYQPHDYLRGRSALARGVLSCLRDRMTRWDQGSARSASRYITTSTWVASRIEDVYGFQPEIVHPPVTINRSSLMEPIPGLEPGYFLIIGNRGYKYIDIACSIFSEMADAQLVVVGSNQRAVGPSHCSENIVFLGAVEDAQLRWLYENCTALLALASEDFGLTPLEANAFGKPALAIRSGGYLDTVVEGFSGLFVDNLERQPLIGAVKRIREERFDSSGLRSYIEEHYSLDVFVAAIRRLVLDVIGESR
jgi:glycosyltransferase involved in cell wall biosynthesis